MFFLKKKKVSELMLNWLDKKDNLKIQSYQRYENLIKGIIIPRIGNITLKEITEERVRIFFQDLSDNEIALSTQKTILYILKSSWDYGIDNRLCHYINFKNIKIKAKQQNIHILSKNEQTILEEKLLHKINIRKLCIILCLYTGLRIGEVCGLKWEDINFEQKSLIIRRTIQRIKNNNKNIKSKTILIESSPKSETSNRIVPIPNFIINILKLFKSNDNYYVISEDSNIYDPRQLESCFERILKSCNIKCVKFHTLRHTFATRSIESKMDIKTLSEILGHSSVEITLRLYVHPSYDMKKNSIENLVLFMNEKLT